MRVIQSFGVEDFSQPNSYLSLPALYLPEAEEVTRLLLLTLFRLTSIIGLDSNMLQFFNTHLTTVQAVQEFSHFLFGERVIFTILLFG